ncbi:MAG: type II toxin-antitoxin system RelB/DinJ family antitoxin [Methylocella sp.]
MPTDSVVRARIDAQVKDAAASVLADMGLTVSDAIRILLIQVAAEKALPFPVKVPKAKVRVANPADGKGRTIKRGLDGTAASPTVGMLKSKFGKVMP